MMYTLEQRAQLRAELLECATQDSRLSGAAITGSAAAEREDKWSDIDLAFGVANASEVQSVLSDWTARMYGRYQALHHLDVKAGAWIYRVFLLPSTLQVDLAFVPEWEFRPLGPTFRLVAGRANDMRPFPSPLQADLVGLGWLYALHARSSMARRKLWQAEYMISAMRGQALALACLRHGLPTAYGRGIDSLPVEVAEQFEGSLVHQLAPDELWRAFGAAIQLLLAEIRSCDAELAARLQEPLLQLWDAPTEASAVGSKTSGPCTQ